MTPDVSVYDLAAAVNAYRPVCDALEPMLDPAYLASIASCTLWRPVVVAVTAQAWSADYVVLLQHLDSGAALARTPEYGGPWIRGDVDDASVTALRAGCDDALRELGVVSEVAMLSPWLPNRDAIAAAWHARPQKRLCLTLLERGIEHPIMRSAKRAREIDRARVADTVTFEALETRNAAAFATQYAAHMERVGASERWRLEADTFQSLVTCGVDASLCTASCADGGATALYLRRHSTATLLYAVRWGTTRNEPLLANVSAHEHLFALGCSRFLLGGGVSDADDDSLLAFKRKLANQETDLFLAARVFDPRAHATAVAEGHARPLPDQAVPA